MRDLTTLAEVGRDLSAARISGPANTLCRDDDHLCIVRTREQMGRSLGRARDRKSMPRAPNAIYESLVCVSDLYAKLPSFRKGTSKSSAAHWSVFYHRYAKHRSQSWFPSLDRATIPVRCAMPFMMTPSRGLLQLLDLIVQLQRELLSDLNTQSRSAHTHTLAPLIIPRA